MSNIKELTPHEEYVIDVLLNCRHGSTVPKVHDPLIPAAISAQPCAPGEKGVSSVVPVLLTTVEGISLLRIYLPKDLRSLEARETVWKSVLEVDKRFPDGIPLLDPISHMNIADDKFKVLVDVGN